MDDRVPGSLSARALAFLAALKDACGLEGFAVPSSDAPLSVGQRWQATMRLNGPLGDFVFTLWTSGSMLEYDGDECRLELALGGQDLTPVYRCSGIEGFKEALEYLKVVAEFTAEPRGLVAALKLGTDPRWWKEERDKFIAIIKNRTELGFSRTVGLA